MYTLEGFKLAQFQLVLQPLPKFAHGENARGVWSRTDWSLLRSRLHRKAQYRCEHCERRGEVELHETWDFGVDPEKASRVLQRMTGLVCLCKGCHAACHLSMWHQREIAAVGQSGPNADAVRTLAAGARAVWAGHPDVDIAQQLAAVRRHEDDLDARYYGINGTSRLDLVVCAKAMTDLDLRM